MDKSEDIVTWNYDVY